MNKQQTLVTGIGLLSVGLGLAVALDPWFLGLVFLIIGFQRVVAALQMSDASD